MATHFESRFCRFEVPSGAMALPGLGVLENRDDRARKTAVVTENWLDASLSAAEYARKQREAILSQVDGEALLEEAPVRGGKFSDAHHQSFEAPGPEGVALRQEQYVAVEGPLAVCLTLTGLAEDRESWKKFFEPVERSFDVPGKEKLRRLVRSPLLSAGGSRASANRAMPPLQIALPVPSGWSLDEAGAALRSPSGARIVVQRSGLPASSPDALFADALSLALGDPALSPRAWDHGATPQGFEAFALESAEVAAGTWVAKEPKIRREVFVTDASAVVFGLEALDGDDAAKAAFAQVFGGYEMLPPGQRRLRVPLAWLPLELSGPWQQGGAGIFVRAALPPLSLAAIRMPAIQGAEKFAEAASHSLRPSASGTQVTREERKQTSWKGAALYRYAVDAAAADGEKTSIRAGWFASGDSVCSVIVRGEEKEAEALFGQCLDQLRPGESQPR